MFIREATEGDWPRIFPFFQAISAAGETYAYPEALSLDEARGYWMAKPPGENRRGGARRRRHRFSHLATVPAAFNHPTHGHVGLHLMFQPLNYD